MPANMYFPVSEYLYYACNFQPIPSLTDGPAHATKPVVGEGMDTPVHIHTRTHILLIQMFPSPLLFIPDFPIFIR